MNVMAVSLQKCSKWTVQNNLRLVQIDIPKSKIIISRMKKHTTNLKKSTESSGLKSGFNLGLKLKILR